MEIDYDLSVRVYRVRRTSHVRAVRSQPTPVRRARHQGLVEHQPMTDNLTSNDMPIKWKEKKQHTHK